MVQTENHKINALKWRSFSSSPKWSLIWHEVLRWLVLVVGAFLSALGYAMFQVPHHFSAGGLGGIGIIVNHFTGWPVGLLFWVMNLPLLVLGYFYLGGMRFVVRTLIGATIFAAATDWLSLYLPTMLDTYPITNDLLLNALYGGIIGGIGGGLVYRAGSTLGGTGIIGRIIQQKTGQPLSQVYLFTDSGIILSMGLVFGWESSLYGLLILFINGLASDYTLEGASTTRTVMIITNQPQAMSAALMETLERGVTSWEVKGGYTGQKHYMLMSTIYRPQVNEVKRIVADIDPNAFLTIALSHQALGRGFTPFRTRHEE